MSKATSLPGATYYHVVAIEPAPGALVLVTANADEADAMAAKYEAQTGSVCRVLVERDVMLLSKSPK
jgi:alpha/beta superfamily hydrolase